MNQRVAVDPPFRAVLTRGGKTARRGQRVDIVEPAPANQSQRSAERCFRTIERIQDVGGNGNGVRGRRNIDERTVDIEK